MTQQECTSIHPDTSPYFAAELAARSLLHRLDRGRYFQPYFNLKVGTPYATAEHASWDYCDMSGRFVDAWILARQIFGWPMTEEEDGVRRFLLAMQNPADGLFYDRKLSDLRPRTLDVGGNVSPYPCPGPPGEREIGWDSPELGQPETADMFCQSRVLLGLVSWLLESGSTEIEGRIEKLIQGLWNIAVKEDDFCYYPGHRYSPKGWDGVSAYAAKDLGHAALPAYGVCQLLPLVRYWEATSSHAARRLILALLNFFVRESGVVKPDGSFTGHLHSWGILPSVVGALRWAMAAGNLELIQWCKKVYDFVVSTSSTFGWVPDGIGVDDGIETGETCCITDLIHLGVKLAQCGHPDCLDFVEIMLRNQLLESQMREPDRFEFDPSPSAPDVRSMIHGAYDSWVMPNGLTGCSKLGMEGCCTASAVRAAYLAWKHAITQSDCEVRVNLMLSRRSEWIDTMSYQPFEGRFSVLIHRATALLVRIPDWVNCEQLRLTVDRSRIHPSRAGSYIELREARPGSRIDFRFPIPRREAQEEIRGRRYRLEWLGPTLMKTEPPGEIYPIFERTLEGMAKLSRFDLQRTHIRPSVEW